MYFSLSCMRLGSFGILVIVEIAGTPPGRDRRRRCTGGRSGGSGGLDFCRGGSGSGSGHFNLLHLDLLNVGHWKSKNGGDTRDFRELCKIAKTIKNSDRLKQGTTHLVLTHCNAKSTHASPMRCETHARQTHAEWRKCAHRRWPLSQIRQAPRIFYASRGRPNCNERHVETRNQCNSKQQQKGEKQYHYNEARLIESTCDLVPRTETTRR